MNKRATYIYLILVLFLAACGGSGGASSVSPIPVSQVTELLISNSRDQNGLNGVVTTIDSSGQLVRSANINTSNGGIIADSVHHELFGVDDLGQQVKTFSLTATGNVFPIRTIVSESLPGYGGDILYDPSLDQIIQIQAVSRYGGIQLAYYPRTSSGTQSPEKIRTLTLQNYRSACLDSKNSELSFAVAQYAGQGPFPAHEASINVFSAVSGDASIRAISGDLTQLTTPSAIAIDNIHDELLVADSASNSILVFGRTANGNVSPIRSIAGSATNLNQPSAIAFESIKDLIYVTNYGGNSVTAYPRSGNGNMSPIKSFGSPQLSLTNPTSIALSIH